MPTSSEPVTLTVYGRVCVCAPARLAVLKLGGVGLASASLDAIWPVHAQGATGFKANPRGNARNVIFYEFGGAISHLDCFDFKESAGTQKDHRMMSPVAWP